MPVLLRGTAEAKKKNNNNKVPPFNSKKKKIQLHPWLKQIVTINHAVYKTEQV